jgi:hypothetical protein
MDSGLVPFLHSDVNLGARIAERAGRTKEKNELEEA